MQKSKSAFTMFELVFVIVVIGILSAVAVTRLDITSVKKLAGGAKVNADLNMCINENANLILIGSTINMDVSTQSCTSASTCFDIVADGLRGIKVTNANGGVDEVNACDKAHLAAQKGSKSSDEGVVFTF